MLSSSADKKTFISFAAKNRGYEEIGKHVSGLMRETITKIITTKIVDTWFSSMHLSPGGKKMYESLQSDPRLKVIETDEYDGENRYKITAK